MVAWHIDGDSLLPGDAISRSGICFRVDPRAAVGHHDDVDPHAVSLADLGGRTGPSFHGLWGSMSAPDAPRHHDPVLVRDARDLAW